MKPETHFPSLPSVARVRRRLKREAVRRTESTAGMQAVKASFAPPRGSIPPEVSLVGVSPERELALAGALETPPPPSVQPRSVPASPPVASTPASSPTSAPAPKLAAAPASTAARPAHVSALEVVTLDFGASPAPAQAPSDAEMPDLELDLTFTSESNFYTDVIGTEVGLFIATWVVKPVGTPLVVRLSLPAVAEPFVVSGVVRWVLEFSPSIEAPPGIGLALEGIRSAARRAIDSFMKVRVPILHDE
jgi:hypothetical protein